MIQTIKISSSLFKNWPNWKNKPKKKKKRKRKKKEKREKKRKKKKEKARPTFHLIADIIESPSPKIEANFSKDAHDFIEKW